jgi:FkbM family methyltransferase
MRNWLRSPARSTEWVWDGLQYLCGVTRDLDVGNGWQLKCHPRAYKVFLRDQVLDPGQSAEFHNFLSHCAKGMRLFDIGAHFGVFSLAAAHAGGEAVAVDPSQDALRIVKIEARLNDYSKRIRAVRAAVTSSSGSMGLLSSGVFSAGYFKVAAHEPESELTSLPAVTIDDLAARFGEPSHIKIDIEGHEAAALRGAAGTFGRWSPLLFLELHNEMIAADGGDPNATLDELVRLGYAAFDFDGKMLERGRILDKAISRVVARRTQ